MEEFIQKKAIFEKSHRGLYLIIPVVVPDGKTFCVGNLLKKEISSNELSDKSNLIRERCKSGYVQKYVLKENNFEFKTFEGPVLSDFQLFQFENGIGFVTLFSYYENNEVNKIYNLVNNGYCGSGIEGSNTYEKLYDRLSDIITSSNLRLFVNETEKDILLNESYVFNFAMVEERFNDLETLDRASINVHKQILLEKEFVDLSEADIFHTYGARDVNKETYRWGSCISSLDISFVYANKTIFDEDDNIKISELMQVESECDLFLTILALVQKYTCMRLNDEYHAKIYDSVNKSKEKKFKKKTIQELKNKALSFRATGTLAPSQISRWNNVCETYRALLVVYGIEEGFSEIEQKIDLINMKLEQQHARKQNMISAVIAVFGLISIVASILTIVDFAMGGASIMIGSLVASLAVIICFVVYWIIITLKE